MACHFSHRTGGGGGKNNRVWYLLLRESPPPSLPPSPPPPPPVVLKGNQQDLTGSLVLRPAPDAGHGLAQSLRPAPFGFARLMGSSGRATACTLRPTAPRRSGDRLASRPGAGSALFFTVLGMFFGFLVFWFCSFLLGVCKKQSFLLPYQE